MDTTQLKQCEFCGITSANPCDTHDKSSACPIYLARADKLKGNQAITDTTTPGAPLPQEALAAVLQAPVAPAAPAPAAPAAPAPAAPAAPHPAAISSIGAAAVHAALHAAEAQVAPVVAAAEKAAPLAAAAAVEAAVTTAEAAIPVGPRPRPPVFTDIHNSPVSPPGTPQPAHPQVIADADTAMDPVNPAYYSRFRIQPIVFIRENNLPFWSANVVKYVCRADAKNGREDIVKALDYLAKELAYLDGNPNWHLATVAQDKPAAA